MLLRIVNRLALVLVWSLTPPTAIAGPINLAAGTWAPDDLTHGKLTISQPSFSAGDALAAPETITGVNWRVTIDVLSEAMVMVAGRGVAKVLLEGSMQHIKQPHPAIDRSVGVPFTFDFSITSPNDATGSLGVKNGAAGKTNHTRVFGPNIDQHFDGFLIMLEGIPDDVIVGEGQATSFKSYTMIFEGVHGTRAEIEESLGILLSEPPVAVLLGVTLIILSVRRGLADGVTAAS